MIRKGSNISTLNEEISTMPWKPLILNRLQLREKYFTKLLTMYTKKYYIYFTD